MSGVQRAVKIISEPRAINTAQFLLYSIAAAAGIAAVVGALSPLFTTTTVGPWLIAAVGGALTAGGVVGAVSIPTGLWWLERVALFIIGISWLALLPAAVYYANTTTSSAIWLVIALLCTAILSLFIRYRRIDWAYLDPTR